MTQGEGIVELHDKVIRALNAMGIAIIDSVFYKEDEEITIGVEVSKADEAHAIHALQSCGLEDCAAAEMFDAVDFSRIYGFRKNK